MKKILDEWLYFKLSKKEYKQCMEEAFRNNLYSLRLVNRVVLVMAICFAYVPLVIENDIPRGLRYMATAIIAAILSIIIRIRSPKYADKRKNIKPFTYIMMALYYINVGTFGLYLGIWSNPDGHAVTFMCILICACFLFVCPALVIFGLTITAMTVFCVLAYIFKAPTIWFSDVINCLMAGCLGLIVTWEIIRLRLETTLNANNVKTSSRRSVILGMSLLAEGRDEDTGSHISRIQKYTEVLARKIHENNSEVLSKEEMEQIILYSPLHDIGKVSIPDSILFKPGKLSSEEFDTMKGHTSFGSDVLSFTEHQMVNDSETIRVAIEIAKYHHEKFDGSGYPEGLKGDKIPISAQIVALADIYDALTSKRVYKDAYDHEDACQIILKGDGRTEPYHFGPEVLNAFKQTANIFREIHDYKNEYEVPLFERKWAG